MRKFYKIRILAITVAILLLIIALSPASFSQEKLSSTPVINQPIVAKAYNQPVSNDRISIIDQSQPYPDSPRLIQKFSMDETPLSMQTKSSVLPQRRTEQALPKGSLSLEENTLQGSMMLAVSCDDTPIGTDDLYVTGNDNTLSISAPGFLTNDIDLDGEALTATLIADGVDHGTLIAFPNGSFTYTTDPGFVGTDQFQYVMKDASFHQSEPITVTIEVRESGNRAPIGSDDTFGALAGNALSIAAPGFLANDIDPDGDALTATLIVDGVDNGTLIAFPNGSFTYTPAPGFIGTDQFQYKMRDSEFNESEAVTVTIEVYEGNRKPVGTDDLFGVVLNTPLSIPAAGFLINDIDPDGDPLTATLILDGVDHGTLIAFPNGSFTYTPFAGYIGPDQFQYKMRDSEFNESDAITVDLEVIGSGVLPVGFADFYKVADGSTLSVAAPGFLLNDVDQDGEALTATLILDGVDHGSLSAFPDGSFTYIPVPGFTGTDQFQYQMRDASNNLSGPVTVTIEVRESDDRAPIGADDTYGALAGTTLTVATPGFLMNDIDQDGEVITAILIVDGVDHGSLSAFPDGSFVYTPDPGFTGNDQFQYKMRDSEFNESGAITVTIVVNEGNRSPLGINDTYAVVINTALNIAAGGFLVNDYDPDGDALTATLIVDGVDHGSLSAFPNGSFTYTPNPGFTGTDQFQYKMRDSKFNESEATTVVLEVVGPNQPPVASAADITAECTGPDGTTVELDGSNSTDPDGGVLTYTWYENGNIIAGPTTSSTSDHIFTTEVHQVKLKVEDECGLASEIDINVTIQDATAPLVEAAFIPTGTPHKYSISCTSSDVCSEIISSTSLILIPDLTNPSVTLKNKKNEYSLDIDPVKNTVSVKAPDAAAFWAMVLADGGVKVNDMQVIDAKYDMNKYKFSFDSYGNLISVKGEIITLRCTATDSNGNTGESETTLPTDLLKSIDSSPTNSDGDVLSLWNRNYPNPFNQSTTIEFNLEVPAFVKVAVFDQMGRMVELLESREMPAGLNKIIWDASQRNSGMYYYRIEYNGNQVTNKMFLIRQ